MGFIHKHICLKLFWFLMALHILNLSVDAPDSHPNYIPEDLNYNDMESIVEILFEQILDIENAFPEHEDDDSNNCLLVKTNFQPVFHLQMIGIENLFKDCDIAVLHNNYCYRSSYYEQFYPEVVPPPPKV